MAQSGLDNQNSSRSGIEQPAMDDMDTELDDSQTQKSNRFTKGECPSKSSLGSDSQICGLGLIQEPSVAHLPARPLVSIAEFPYFGRGCKALILAGRWAGIGVPGFI